MKDAGCFYFKQLWGIKAVWFAESHDYSMDLIKA